MNYYRSVEKKPEHGAGWAFMQLNRRSGAAIRCGCGAGGWTGPGHATAWEADRCFYDDQLAREIRRSVMSNQQLKCRLCSRWTSGLVSAGRLLFDGVVLCEQCAPPDDDAKTRASLATVVQFVAGIQIAASW